MYLHILWNILKYLKHIKYRQINKQALYNCLFSKCHTLNANLEQIIIDMEIYIYKLLGSKKEMMIIGIINMIIFKCYICGPVIKQHKTGIGIPERVCILSNGKWKDYWILFDYQHRTIMLFDENKSKIKLLQVGNPNKSSLEFNVSIQWYNDLND
ncbi:hypothetical protein RFI_05473, partial [Reticulomyxa filosa]